MRAPLGAAGVLLVLLLAFFSTPLARLGRSYYSSADLSQDTLLTHTQGPNRSSNPLLSDPAVQMQPWLMFNRDAFAAGELPLWNDWNGAGAPHLANYQSAVFAPFSVPFYLLGFRWALLLSAFGKLLCLGFFTYLFLRAIDLRHFAAIFGAVAFTFSGLNVLLLGYPHSAVAITLPAGLWCIEKAIRARETEQRGKRWIAGLGVVLACGLFGGHPEPFCFSLVLIGAYTIARLWPLWSTRRASAAALAGELALVGVLAAGLAAVQIVPFLEYLANSTVLATRSQGQPALAIANWPLWFVPDLLGNPSAHHVIAYELPHPNYEDVNTAYAGALVVWLTVLGTIVARDRRFWFFAACALIGIVYGYDLTGAGHLAGRNLVMSALPMNRSQIVVVFGLCGCAALTVDRLCDLPANARRRVLIGAASSAAAIALVAWLGARQLFARTMASAAPITPAPELEAFTARHGLQIAALFAIGVVACAAIPVARAAWTKRACAIVLVLAVFASSGFLLKDYNPTIDDETFFPRTPLIQDVQRAVGDKRLMILGERCLPSDTNLPYALRVASNYDALWVREFDTLYQGLFDAKDNWRIATRATEAGLKLCGIEYVLTANPWLAVDASAEGGGSDATREIDGVNLGQRRAVRQTFVADKDRLQAIELRVMHPVAGKPRALRVKLEDASSGATVASADLAAELDALPMQPGLVWRPVIFSFAPIEGSRGRSYRLVVQTAEGPGDAVFLWALRKTPPRPGEKYEVDERTPNGRLWFNCSYNLDAFELCWRKSAYSLWRYKRSPTRYYCVDRAEVAASDEAALQRVLSPDFDAARSVVLSACADASPMDSGAGAAGAATVILDDHSHVKLRVERSAPGYLVITRSHYPGWRVRVNGVERPLLRANFGLCAVRVEPGTSDVELDYEPASFRIGAWCAAFSVLAGAIWFALAARRSIA